MSESQSLNLEKYLTDPSWKKVLKKEFSSDYMKELSSFLFSEQEKGVVIFPPIKEVFSAFNLTPLNKTKVVIIGQDPYHRKDQAHGLCFSVKKGIKIPPSLKNIYKELHTDLGITIPEHGYLVEWAKEGVLMINAVLTVEEGKPGSHHKKGWEQFTDKVISILNSEKENLVFILWGAPAQKKGRKIDTKRHLVIKSPHPSPLSSYRGFFGSKPFSQTNAYLEKKGLAPVDWNINT